MQLINLSILSALVASASAADCFGPGQHGLNNFADAYWEAREKMCGNKDCGYQQECTTYASKKVAGVEVKIALTRKYTGSKKGFGDCWGGTENIINQCVNSEARMSGIWAWNNQLYVLNSWYP